MKLALKTAIATATLACAMLLSFNWSERHGVLLGVETAQAKSRVYAKYSYVAARPELAPRYYSPYGPGVYFFCTYNAGCGYGTLRDYYRAHVVPGFPASFYNAW